MIPLAVILAIWIPNFFESDYSFRWYGKVQANFRSMETCLESYFADYNAYPLPARGEKGANSNLKYNSRAFNIPTFPVNSLVPKYCKEYLEDPVAENGATFSYYSNGHDWILISPGIDRDYDIVPSKDFGSSIRQPDPDVIFKIYDPTNGMKSNGDIIRMKAD